MNLSKPRSVNFFVTVFSLTGLLLLTIIGLNMFREISIVETQFSSSHAEAANNEFQRGVDTVVSKAKEVIDRVSTWDESSQQLSDPTYYRFWRERRLQTAQFIPDYIDVMELYDKDGKALLEPREKLMPLIIPDKRNEIVFENNQPWLCLFKPIYRHQTSKEIFGYVGIKINLLPALLKLNVFTHLDAASLRFNAPHKLNISPDQITEHVTLKELHSEELDQLKYITYKTFAYIVVLVIFIIILLYWLIIVLFAKPLVKLNKHIDSIKRLPIDAKIEQDLADFPLDEFNNFTQSLQQYQLKLNITQNDLHKLNNDLEQRVIERTSELESKNKELEAFSYSVSHDLRSPLRSIDGFSQMLYQDYYDELGDEGKDYINRIRSNTQRMADLIDDLLNLARISRVELRVTRVNLSEKAVKRIEQLKEQNPERQVTTRVQDNLHAYGDESLISILLNNLIDNAWKYSAKTSNAVIELGSNMENDEEVFFIKDNGIGFDMKYVNKIFEVFHRLHNDEYEGTGIGLATVRRIVLRHGGRIWVEATPNEGSCFYFTL